ncbi:hypothetical protein [uncultured Lacinutrix sp.]|uniref:hypothetical protein n=1 Tax=uncultured Lacinutrix sp. TaxID=574032 RepID=UPI00261C5905|nr:hypothetical protein [uncultured Lacinutrix sp.]
MKIKYIFLLLGLLIFSCKNESKSTALENKTEIEKASELTEVEKTEIVKYYLINGRKLDGKNFYKIIFLNDISDGVKVIHYEGRDAFFGFPFHEALKFYNDNKN